MARPLRIQFEDALYHIISRGNERMMIFLEDADRIRFINQLHCCRYIVLNPWEAKLVEHPKDWKWSRYQRTAGLSKPAPFLTTDWLMEIFGSDVKKARYNYVKFIEADMNGERSKSEYKYQLFLGSDEFAESILKRYGPFSSMKGINNTQLGFGRPTLNQIFNRRKLPKEARNQAIIKAYRDYKFPLKDIAAHLRMNPNYLCAIIKREET